MREDKAMQRAQAIVNALDAVMGAHYSCCHDAAPIQILDAARAHATHVIAGALRAAGSVEVEAD